MWLPLPSPAVILIGDQGRCYTQVFIYDGHPYNLLVLVLVLNSTLFTHMCCFTGTKGIALLPQCYWCNPEKYGWSQPSQNHNKSQQIMNSVLIWLGKLPWKPLLWLLSWYHIFNSLAPRRFEWNFRQIIFMLNLVIDGWCISGKIALRWKSLDRSDDKSTLVQVMAWCCQAASQPLPEPMLTQICVAIWRH